MRWRPRATLSASASAFVVVGLVFGISNTAVTPPSTAAGEPVSRSSFWVSPGSRKCTWVSMTPGRTCRPLASITAPPVARARSPIAAIRPPVTPISRTPSPSWLTTVPPRTITSKVSAIPNRPLRHYEERLTFRRIAWQGFRHSEMKAAPLPDRGVLKVAGEPARGFLNGLLTADIDRVTPARACFAALLTPQGKIVADCIVAEAPPEDGGGFFLDVPRALAVTLVDKLNFYKLRAKLIIEDLSEVLGVLAAWDGQADTDYGLAYTDPRLPALGMRVMLPPHLAAQAAADLGAELVDAAEYEARRIALGVPRGGLDFIYGDAFPHETDMDQLNGVDFAKGCYVGQEVVSRIEHRGSARTRIVPVAYDGFAPEPGAAVTAAAKPVGTFGSTADGRGLAMLRLDRVEDAMAEGLPLVSGGATLRLIKPDWARFAFPGPAKASETKASESKIAESKASQS